MKILQRIAAVLLVLLTLAGAIYIVKGAYDHAKTVECFIGDRRGCLDDDRDALRDYVMSSMQEHLETDAYLKRWHLTVTQLVVLKQSDHQFQGAATVVLDGTPHTVPVDITVDGARVMWQVRSGGFGFIAQKELLRLQAELEDASK